MNVALADSKLRPRAARAGEQSLRVLMGVPSAGATGGGPALHLPMLVEDLRAGGIDVRTFAFGRWAEGEGIVTKILHQMVDLVRFPMLLRRTAPDCVQLNSSLDRRALVRDVPFVWMSRAFGCPVLVKWHGSELEFLQAGVAPLWRFLARQLLRGAHTIAVLSSEEERALRAHGDAPASAVVHNGLDLQRYARTTDVRTRLGIPAAAPVLLFVGRLLPAKGLLDVIAALPAITARHDAHLVVVGDGPTRAAAAARAAALEVSTRVHFQGQIPEDAALDFYCGGDVLVFPTYHAEGFPMVVFQSLAAGLGIVTTRIRATADHLHEPANALFVPPRDPAALAAAVIRLLEDPELLGAMRRNNRERARRFDRSAVAARFAALYNDMVPAGFGRAREDA